MGERRDILLLLLGLFIIINTILNLTSAVDVTEGLTEIDMTECGVSKGCMAYPLSCVDQTSSDDCVYLVTYKVNDTDSGYIDFEMSAQYEHDYMYLAIAFSYDDKMGKDDISACYLKNSGSLYLKHSYNEGYENEGFNSDTGYENVKGTRENGVLRCSFSRIVDNTGLEDKDYFDLSKDWVLVVTAGEMDSDSSVEEHYEIPRMSSGLISLTSTEVIGVMGVNSYIQAHGILMMISWLLLAVLGITTSRFYKDIWPDVKLLGVPIWFQIHRIVMTATVVLSVIGFICIVVYWKGWDEEAGTHGIMGIVVLTLGIVNPVIALFRPAPGEGTKRKVWKLIHSLVGGIGHGLSYSVITLALGLDLIRNPLYGYIGLLLCFLVFLVWTILLWVVRCKFMCDTKCGATTDPGTENTDGMTSMDITPSTNDSKRQTGIKIHKISFVVCVTLLIASLLMCILGTMVPWHNL